MKELPEGWARSTVGALWELKYGKSLPEKARQAGDFEVYGSNGAVGTHIKPLTSGPTIILGRKGSIGELHFSAAPCFPIDTTYFIDDFSGCEVGFVAWLMRSLPLKTMNRATAIPGLSREDAYSLDVPVPPLAEQRRIVEKLDALTARTTRARADLNRISALAARYKQAVLARAFSGELTTEWRKSCPVEPATWRQISVGDLAQDVRYGTAAKCNFSPSETPVLRIPNIAKGRIDTTDLKHATFDDRERAKLALEVGDVLVIRSNGSVSLVGRAAVVTPEVAGFLYAGYLIRLRLDLGKVKPDYLQLAFEESSTRAVIESFAKSTSGVNNINSEQLKGLAIPLPSLAEQSEIVRRVGKAFAKIDRLTADAATAGRLLDRLDQAVLAKAFRGELIPQDPTDEPASVLLDKIKAERGAEDRKPKSRGGRKSKGAKEQAMNGKPLLPRERILEDSENWPALGLPFEDIATRNAMPHDQLRDALFELLAGSSPALQQRFDTDAEMMIIQRIAA